MFRPTVSLALATLAAAATGCFDSALSEGINEPPIGGQAQSPQTQGLHQNLQAGVTQTDSQRVEEAFSSRIGNGSFGARVKRVGGPVTVSVNDQNVFDPASALKVAHYTHALGEDFNSLAAPAAFSYPVDPQNPNSTTPCPDDAWLVNTNTVNTSIANALVLMMQNSDNRVTRAFEDRYDRANINATMAQMGMSQSSLHQFIGCGYANGIRNRTTARDLALLYEKVALGSVLGPAPRQTFFALISQGLPQRVRQVILDEAADLGKGQAFVADFVNKTRLYWKSGSYNICGVNSCNGYEYVRSQAGLMTLPVKPQCNANLALVQAPEAASRQIAYARYITGLYIPCTPQGSNETRAAAEARCPQLAVANAALDAAESEMVRGEIRAAIKTWDVTCTGAAPEPPRGLRLRPIVRGGRSLPGIDPDEIDFAGSDNQDNNDSPRAPAPGIDPDEIDFVGSDRQDESGSPRASVAE